MNVTFSPSLNFVLNYSTLDIETQDRVSETYSVVSDANATIVFTSKNGIEFINSNDGTSLTSMILHANVPQTFKVRVLKDSINSIIPTGRFMNLIAPIAVTVEEPGPGLPVVYYYQLLTTPSSPNLSINLPNTNATGVVYLRKIGPGINTSQPLTLNDVSITVNPAYNLQLGISDIKVLPDGSVQFTVNRKSGATFTPADANQINVSITNGNYKSSNNQTLSTTFTVAGNNIVNVDPLNITTVQLNTATDKISYFDQLVAVGGTLPYTWSLINNTKIFDGLTLNSTGVVSGTPNGVGSSRFDVRVMDSRGMSTQKSIDLIVLQGTVIIQQPKILKILGLTNYSAIVGQHFDSTILFEGGTEPYVWNGTNSGEFVFPSTGQKLGLPNFIMVRPNGTVAGIPQDGTQGSYKFGIEVTSGDGQYDRIALELGVQGLGGGSGGTGGSSGGGGGGPSTNQD